MKHLSITIILILFAINTMADAQLQVNSGRAYKYETNVATSLLNMGCYVVQRDIPVSIIFKSDSDSPMKMYRFGESGSSQKEEIYNAIQQGNVLTYNGGDKDCGYIIEQDREEYVFWVSGYRQVTTLDVDYTYTNMCDNARIEGEGISIIYYTKDGLPRTIPRKVKFNTWQWNNDEEIVEKSVEVEQYFEPATNDKLVFKSPYEKTYITIIDDIPTYWSERELQITTSEEFVPKAIFAKAIVSQDERDIKNEINTEPDAGSYGGSAPVDMVFEAIVNEDNYFCWQFFKSKIGPDDPSPVIFATYLDETLKYTFNEAGTTYVRLHVENSMCSQDITYTIVVNESFLDAPNAFSPGTSPGINDEWKVAYKSIVEFKCVIFDRWGVKIYAFEDPSGGWNGEYNGKLVPPGVYFYVIQAKGSDGHKYELKGHINILRSKD